MNNNLLLKKLIIISRGTRTCTVELLVGVESYMMEPNKPLPAAIDTMDLPES